MLNELKLRKKRGETYFGKEKYLMEYFRSSGVGTLRWKFTERSQSSREKLNLELHFQESLLEP